MYARNFYHDELVEGYTTFRSGSSFEYRGSLKRLHGLLLVGSFDFKLRSSICRRTDGVGWELLLGVSVGGKRVRGNGQGAIENPSGVVAADDNKSFRGNGNGGSSPCCCGFCSSLGAGRSRFRNSSNSLITGLMVEESFSIDCEDRDDGVSRRL